ncbi:MAG: metal-dependent hydrolase [Halobacteria archaeon]|nr:metal-dependent hydrolase [Halobacteria archaeon]
MEITWYGHSFFEVVTSNGTEVLVDPFITDNPTNDVSPDEFDPDVVAVTHGHFDHLADAPAFDAPVVCQPEITEWLADQGHEDAVGFNVGGTYEHDGVSFTMVQAFHSSGTPGESEDFEGYGGTPAGYVIDDGDTTFYHSGDTALFGDMKTVVRDVYEPDVAAVPIGDHFTMGPEDAATAVGWLGVDDALPMHYDTFPPIEQDPDEFAEATDADVTVLEVGDTADF